MFLNKIRKFSAAAAAMLLLSSPVYASAEGIPEMLVPMGELVGINLQTKGVIVAGIGEVETENGTVSPAKDAGLQQGDVILMVNGHEVDTVEDLTAEFCACGEKASVKILREGEERQLTVEPYHFETGASIGVWVRDELNGIGTLTFYDPETGIFGALGHSVSDSEVGSAVEFKGGTVAPATVGNVTAGEPGTPGQLGGVFDIENDAFGVIISNDSSGIYGVLDEIDAENATDVGSLSEIKVGQATILSTVEGSEAREYDIEIVRVYSDEKDNRSMMLRVTDEDLLETTGGIVQGMSGSPIMQDGKLIGAVTHVLISDPTKGYGISIDKMLEAAYGPMLQ